MIDAKELRIGNLIIINDDYYDKSATGKIVCVTKIDSERYHQENKGVVSGYAIDDEYKDINGYWLKNIEPIPISEEWLLNLGFVEGHKCDDYHNFIILDPFYIVVFKNNNFYLHINGKFSILVKYIHSLQNLYFALTQKELEIK
jgi:hypothetical protein